ncbi:MAG TPA: STAS domain-containing protein [Herpetosiphonaceae bacterium]
MPLNRVVALYRIGEELMRAETEDQAFQITARGLVSQVGYANAWIPTIDRAAHLLRGRAGAGIGMQDDTPTTLSFPLDSPHDLVRVAVTGKPNVVIDAVAVAEGEGWGDEARGTSLRSAVQVPFGTASEVLGIIAVGTNEKMQPDEELTLLSLFGMQLTSALTRIRSDNERERQFAALEAASLAQQRLLETVRELSTPAIPVYDGILVLPLVGNIDTGRAGQLMEAVLTSIQREHSSVVILDVTGVPVMDTGVANHILQVTHAARLLGAQCMLVGIRPEVAQTLVQLGADLSGIITRSDLQAGVAYALHQRGLRIVPV